jgi:hypothetical protein
MGRCRRDDEQPPHKPIAKTWAIKAARRSGRVWRLLLGILAGIVLAAPALQGFVTHTGVVVVLRRRFMLP